MKVVGVIAEYNPFHKGHAYHLQQIRELYHADFVITVISGDFVQRGEPAICDKFTRTNMALLGGSDLMLELPVPFATGSGEYFAAGAVSLLDSLGVVDAICFGSECGEITSLMEIADILAKEPQEFSTLLKDKLQAGQSYPAARMSALVEYSQNPQLGNILTSPNNILGIEYCKSLRKLNSSMVPLTIPRKDSSYHQQELSQQFSSATAIRRIVSSGELASLSAHLPEQCLDVFSSALMEYGYCDLNDYSLLLKYRLMNETSDSLCEYLDVSPDLANRILSRMDELDTFREFIKCLKTRDLTFTRISRALLHILLNIKAFPMDWQPKHLPAYGRILGFRQESTSLLSAIKSASSIPLISKVGDGDKLLSGNALTMLNQDIWCANLYESVLAQKNHRPFLHECRRPVVKV